MENEDMLPVGSIIRICKLVVKKKDSGMTAEVAPALNKAMSKLVTTIMDTAVDIELAKNRKRVTLDSLKQAGEKHGILIE